MQSKTRITWLILCIAMLAAAVSSYGIFSSGGPGPTTFTSVRGLPVTLYGEGAYRDMSAEVAPQGIAQDYVTLFVAVPLLLVSLYFYRKNSLRGKLLLTGITGYLFVTYLFFTLMAMYNVLFLPWVILLSLCFFTFLLLFRSLDSAFLNAAMSSRVPARFIGGFLMFCAVSIGLLWLSIVLPHALRGTIPAETEHYTTLVVQALDLAILLPAAFISGRLLYRRTNEGMRAGVIYVIFLTVQMTALTAKVIAMGVLGYSIIPVVFIIPTFNLVALACTVAIIRSVRS
jgi:hypothetical protein